MVGALAAFHRRAPGAIVGVIISAYLHKHMDIKQLESVLRIAVAIALLLSATGIILNRKLAGEMPTHGNGLPTLRLGIIGFFVGLCVSITSIGAGSLMLPLLLVVAPMVALRRLVGTDLAFAVVVLVPSLIGHLKIGDVNPMISASLLIGSIPGVFVGSFGDEIAGAVVPRCARGRARRRRARATADSAARERLAHRLEKAFELAGVRPPTRQNVVMQIAGGDVGVVHVGDFQFAA